MKLICLVLIFLAILVSTGSGLKRNYEPIIGVLTQQLSSKMKEKYPNYGSYIASSYIKFVETGGARAVPLWINKPKEYYKEMMGKLNGVIFPGGAAAFSKTTGYSKAGKYIYDIAVDLNKKGTHFPLWGTCLGFELLTFLSANMTAHRVKCNSQSQSLALDFKPDFKTSKMFKYAPQTVIDILATKKVTANFHSYCLTDAVLARMNLDREWRSISLNQDWKGFEFISSMEHKQYPFYGVQFHPEKNMFEWIRNKNISHTADAVLQAQYFANFFVKEAKKNFNEFSDSNEERRHLIYNFPTTHSGLTGSAFQECYFFDKDVDYLKTSRRIIAFDFDTDFDSE